MLGKLAWTICNQRMKQRGDSLEAIAERIHIAILNGEVRLQGALRLCDTYDYARSYEARI